MDYKIIELNTRDKTGAGMHDVHAGNQLIKGSLPFTEAFDFVERLVKRGDTVSAVYPSHTNLYTYEQFIKAQGRERDKREKKLADYREREKNIWGSSFASVEWKGKDGETVWYQDFTYAPDDTNCNFPLELQSGNITYTTSTADGFNWDEIKYDPLKDIEMVTARMMKKMGITPKTQAKRIYEIRYEPTEPSGIKVEDLTFEDPKPITVGETAHLYLF